MSVLEGFFTVDELARLFKVKPATIYTWNSKGTGPKVTKVGRRTVRYAVGDVSEWMCQNRQYAVDLPPF
jgi:predicted DNA-binding transcriptional regulator AlpA